VGNRRHGCDQHLSNAAAINTESIMRIRSTGSRHRAVALQAVQ
jgi:hypothetical protein